jgi:hypothetical protein
MRRLQKNALIKVLLEIAGSANRAIFSGGCCHKAARNNRYLPRYHLGIFQKALELKLNQD